MVRFFLDREGRLVIERAIVLAIMLFVCEQGIAVAVRAAAGADFCCFGLMALDLVERGCESSLPDPYF